MRKLAAFTVSFALGICLAQYLLPERLLLPVAAVFFAAACLALLLPGLWRKRVLLVGTGLALALGWNWLYSYAVRAPLAALSGSEGTASMTLLEYAVPTDYGAKVTVKLEGVPLGKVVCYGGADLLDLEPGQTVAAQVKFQDSARLREDTITNFTAQGVFLLAYQRGDEAVYGEGSAGSPRWWPAHAARAMQNRVPALFDGDEAAFLSAILTGDTSGLSEEARSDLSEAGLSHILAVSGMHCGFLMTLILLLTGRHRHRLAAVLALLCGGVLKVVTNYLMVGDPATGIRGAAVSTLYCYALIVLIDLIAIARLVPERPGYIRLFARPVLVTAVMALAARSGYGLFCRVLPERWAVLPAIAVAAAVYGILALATGAVTRTDVVTLPKGEKIADFLHLR